MNVEDCLSASLRYTNMPTANTRNFIPVFCRKVVRKWVGISACSPRLSLHTAPKCVAAPSCMSSCRHHHPQSFVSTMLGLAVWNSLVHSDLSRAKSLDRSNLITFIHVLFGLSFPFGGPSTCIENSPVPLLALLAWLDMSKPSRWSFFYFITYECYH